MRHLKQMANNVFKTNDEQGKENEHSNCHNCSGGALFFGRPYDTPKFGECVSPESACPALRDLLTGRSGRGPGHLTRNARGTRLRAPALIDN